MSTDPKTPLPHVTNFEFKKANVSIGQTLAHMAQALNLGNYTMGMLDAVAMLEQFEKDVRTDNQENLANFPMQIASKPDIATIVMCKALVDHFAQNMAMRVPVFEQIDEPPPPEPEEVPPGTTVQ